MGVIHRGSSYWTKKCGAALEPPPAADVQDLPGDVVGFFRGEKIHRRGDILRGGRPSNGKPRITNAARFAEGKLFFINIRRIDDVHGDAVFGFLDCQGTREGYDRGLSRSVRRNLRLTKGALGPDGAHVDDASPALPPHLRQRR